MQIIGGLAKGHGLCVPRGIRPTSTLLKRKLFDSHQTWEAVNFIDLCAGSGSVGLEAWSRGAKSVCLVEQGAQPIGPLGLEKKQENVGRPFSGRD